MARAALAACLAAALSVGSAQVDPEPILEPYLAGTTGGLRWALYPAGDYTDVLPSERGLVIVPNPIAKVVGAKYDQAELIFATRVPAEEFDESAQITPETTQWLFHGYEKQFLEQGYDRIFGSHTITPTFARARYEHREREDLTFEFHLERVGSNLYRYRVNMLGAAR